MTQDFSNNFWKPETPIIENQTPEIVHYPDDVSVNWVLIESLMTKACENASEKFKNNGRNGYQAIVFHMYDEVGCICEPDNVHFTIYGLFGIGPIAITHDSIIKNDILFESADLKGWDEIRYQLSKINRKKEWKDAPEGLRCKSDWVELIESQYKTCALRALLKVRNKSGFSEGYDKNLIDKPLATFFKPHPKITLYCGVDGSCAEEWVNSSVHYSRFGLGMDDKRLVV